MNRYVYLQSEPGLYTVGFFLPSGKWEPESDHDTRQGAADRVAYLNGDTLADAYLAACAELGREPKRQLSGELDELDGISLAVGGTD
jgi:hypothetical protein